MDNKSAKEVLDFLEKYDEHFKELRAFINLKQEKIAGDDVVWLLDSIKSEEKFVMRGNSLEAKRLIVFEDAGVENYNAEQLLDCCPEEFKGRMKLAVDSIDEAVNYIKETNKDALEMARRKLEVQADLLQNSSIAGNNTYDNSGSKIKKMGSDNIIGSV